MRSAVIKTYDVPELSMTKDFADFDRNFIRYLRISIEADRAMALKQIKVREKVDSMVEQVVKRKLLGQRAPNSL
jgi:hypothetical protein